MILARIRSHNYLNGFLFSTIEFFITALVISPFAVYYLTHAKYVYALVSLGIIFNCLPILYCGIESMVKKEKDFGIQRMYQKDKMQEIRKRYPHMLSDTAILVVAILLPFVAFGLFIFEKIYKKNKNKR